MFGWLFKSRANKSSSITAQQLEALLPLQDAVIVDVREPSEYAQGHIPSALNRPLSRLAAKVAAFRRGRSCTSSARAGCEALEPQDCCGGMVMRMSSMCAAA